MGDRGLFGPDSMTWRINREGVLLVGGGAAVILQVAHPLVGAGVAEHSTYREDPWGRLYRTLELTTTLVFGTTEAADDASRRLAHIHSRVHGVTTEAGGPFPAGSPYNANDADLLMWVHATLVDTSLQVYRRYVGPLTIAEERRYYEEQKLLGEKFGIPREGQPATFAEFNEYFDAMVHGEVLAVTSAARDVAEATLRPDLPFLARPLVEALGLATASLLPGRLRADLGLAWDAKRERLVAASRGVLRTAMPALPGLLRDFPPARSADRRVRVA